MNTNQQTFDRCIRKMEELWQIRTTTNETILQRLMTLLNITERLQVMQNNGSFQLLPYQTDLRMTMLAITASSIEQKFQQIHELMRAMLSSMQDMTKLVAATSKALPAGSKRSAGHLQLLADLEDIQDAWHMAREDLCMKLAVVSLLRPDMTPGELQQLITLWQGEPHIHSARVEAVFHKYRAAASSAAA